MTQVTVGNYLAQRREEVCIRDCFAYADPGRFTGLRQLHTSNVAL